MLKISLLLATFLSTSALAGNLQTLEDRTCKETSFFSLGPSLGVKTDTQTGEGWYAGGIIGQRHTTFNNKCEETGVPITGLLVEASKTNRGSAWTLGLVEDSWFHVRYTNFMSDSQNVAYQSSRSVTIGAKFILEFNVGVQQNNDDHKYLPVFSFGLGI